MNQCLIDLFLLTLTIMREEKTKTKAQECNWFDTILGVIYCIFFIPFNLCPVLGQLNAIHTLCNDEEYLDNPNKYVRIRSHFQLILNGYLVAYLMIFITYNYLVFVFFNFNNEEEKWKKYIAWTLGTLIFKWWYEGLKYGFELIYDDTTSKREKFIGHIILTIGSFGLFLFLRIPELIMNHWNSPNPWIRHPIQGIVGLIVFKGWYEAFRLGKKWVYGSDSLCCCEPDNDDISRELKLEVPVWKKGLGYIFLIFATFGLYILFWIFEKIIKNWNSENFWKRNIAQAIGGLLFFKLWYELFCLGIRWVYQDQNKNQNKCISFCKRIIGFLLLIVTSLGTYILYGTVEFIINNWHSKNFWIRNFVQLIGGLIVFKILYVWYEGFCLGFKLAYPNKMTCLLYICFTDNHKDNDSTKDSNYCRMIAGYLLLVITSLGLYLLYWPIEAIIMNWHSKSYWKRNAAQWSGGLIIFKLLYESLNHGIKMVYPEESVSDKKSNVCYKIIGFGLLVFGSLGLYIPYWICETWYILFFKGIKLVYYDQYQDQDQTKEEPTRCQIGMGYVCLIFTTVGLYIPFGIVEITIKKWYKGLVLSYKVAYESESMSHRIIGRIGLIIFSLGLYILWMIGEYMYWLCVNLNEPPYSTKYLIGVIQLSIITFGLYGIYHLTKSLNVYERYIAKIIIIVINLGIYGLIYYFVIFQSLNLPMTYAKYVLLGFSLINYIVFLVCSWIYYNEGPRYCCEQIWKGCVKYVWWPVCHCCDHLKYFVSLCIVKMRNTISLLMHRIKKVINGMYVHLNNVIIPQMIGENARQISDSRYIRPTEYQLNIHPLPILRSWEQKMHDRFLSEKAIKEQQLTMTIYCVDSVIGYSYVVCQEKLGIIASKKHRFWASRYQNNCNHYYDQKIVMEDTRVYGGISMLQLRDHLFSDEAMPSMNLNKDEYDKKMLQFKEYIHRLKSIKKAVFEKNYRCLDSQIKTNSIIV